MIYALFFIAGIIVGMLLCILTAIVVFPTSRDHMSAIMKNVDRASEYLIPHDVAEILEPTSIEDEAITAVIEENKARGKDTKIEEL